MMASDTQKMQQVDEETQDGTDGEKVGKDWSAANEKDGRETYLRRRQRVRNKNRFRKRKEKQHNIRYGKFLAPTQTAPLRPIGLPPPYPPPRLVPIMTPRWPVGHPPPYPPPRIVRSAPPLPAEGGCALNTYGSAGPKGRKKGNYNLEGLQTDKEFEDQMQRAIKQSITEERAKHRLTSVEEHDYMLFLQQEVSQDAKRRQKWSSKISQGKQSNIASSSIIQTAPTTGINAKCWVLEGSEYIELLGALGVVADHWDKPLRLGNLCPLLGTKDDFENKFIVQCMKDDVVLVFWKNGEYQQYGADSLIQSNCKFCHFHIDGTNVTAAKHLRKGQTFLLAYVGLPSEFNNEVLH